MERKVRLMREPRSAKSLVFSNHLLYCALCIHPEGCNVHNEGQVVRGSGMCCIMCCTHHRDVDVKMLVTIVTLLPCRGGSAHFRIEAP